MKDKYELWLTETAQYPDLKNELVRIADSHDEIYDRFFTELQFGTGGLRGVLGAGTNRMNVFTVRRAAKGLGLFIKENRLAPSVAVSYDSRHMSNVFSEESAAALASLGIRVFIYPYPMPTPLLSFAVRQLGCGGGIMITASHNPAEYNGFKCYGNDGCQMTDNNADAVLAQIEKIDYFERLEGSFRHYLESGVVTYIGKEVEEEFKARAISQQRNPGLTAKAELSVVYTPLNGTGMQIVPDVLLAAGVNKLYNVAEQSVLDGDFATCSYPNPEFEAAWELAFRDAARYKPDLVLATDPDSDRVGTAVPFKDGYRILSGNDVGCLLAYYLLTMGKERGTLPDTPVLISTIVTTPLAAAIAKSFGCEVREVLTGFKYIGEQMLQLELAGEESRYIFGFEESIGYLPGSYCRDKDAVTASMLIAEMTAYYKLRGKSLLDALEEIFSRYGVYLNNTQNLAFPGEQGMHSMKSITDKLRSAPLVEIAGYKVTQISDYLLSESINTESGKSEEITLPKSNVLSYQLGKTARVVVRPSGTEPKLKIYYCASAGTKPEAELILEKLLEGMKPYVQ